jgi:hypothetical protein
MSSTDSSSTAVPKTPSNTPFQQPPSGSSHRIPVTPSVLRSIFASSRTIHEATTISRVAFFRQVYLHSWNKYLLAKYYIQVHRVSVELSVYKLSCGQRTRERRCCTTWGGVIDKWKRLHTTDSTRPLCGDITATTLLDSSNALPPLYTTRSPVSALIPSTPRSFSKFVDASAYAWSFPIRPLDSRAAFSANLSRKTFFSENILTLTHDTSKRVFRTCHASDTPRATVTPFSRRVRRVVSFVRGGPSRLPRALG